MPVYKIDYEYSEELHERIISDIENSLDKELIERVLGVFNDAGLPIKVKHLFPDTPNAYYRILCFIKKSAEAVIINTRTDLGKEGVTEGLSTQVRIANKNTFDKLDQFTENIRTQIIKANDCRFCSDKCEGKRYEFEYNDDKYVKCHYLCSNFCFTIHDIADIEDIISIIKDELAFAKTKNSRKKSK